jgi:hypothetical protein
VCGNVPHIEEVLANVDLVALDESDRQRLRFVALVHDTFKHRVDRDQPRVGENHHAMKRETAWREPARGGSN